jgi:peptidoglycan/xylan/chitin deacetylase (PgdA/CDA1 family)
VARTRIATTVHPRESAARRVAKRLVAGVLQILLRCSSRRAGVALLYHGIADRAQDPASDLVPPIAPSLFERQVRHLARVYTVVPASELPAAVARRRRGQRFPVAITFDDEHHNHLPVAAPALARHGVPATFFLTGSALDEPRLFWWERVQAAYDRDALDDDLLEAMPEPVATAARSGSIRALGDAITELSPDERDGVAQALERRLGPDPEQAGMRAADIRALAAEGHEIGFHTLRHDYLPNLDDDQLAAAMVDGRETLAELAGAEVKVLAYPSGGVDDRVADAARAAGYQYAFTTRRVAVRTDSDPRWLGRVTPPPDNVSQLELVIARALAGR